MFTVIVVNNGRVHGRLGPYTSRSQAIADAEAIAEDAAEGVQVYLQPVRENPVKRRCVTLEPTARREIDGKRHVLASRHKKLSAAEAAAAKLRDQGYPSVEVVEFEQGIGVYRRGRRIAAPTPKPAAKKKRPAAKKKRAPRKKRPAAAPAATAAALEATIDTEVGRTEKPITTKGTRIKWSTLDQWLDGYKTLKDRPPSKKEGSDRRSHREALNQHLKVLVNADPETLDRVWQIFKNDRSPTSFASSASGAVGRDTQTWVDLSNAIDRERARRRRSAVLDLPPPALDDQLPPPAAPPKVGNLLPGDLLRSKPAPAPAPAPSKDQTQAQINQTLNTAYQKIQVLADQLAERLKADGIIESEEIARLAHAVSFGEGSTVEGWNMLPALIRQAGQSLISRGVRFRQEGRPPQRGTAYQQVAEGYRLVLDAPTPAAAPPPTPTPTAPPPAAAPAPAVDWSFDRALLADAVSTGKELSAPAVEQVEKRLYSYVQPPPEERTARTARAPKMLKKVFDMARRGDIAGARKQADAIQGMMSLNTPRFRAGDRLADIQSLINQLVDYYDKQTRPTERRITALGRRTRGQTSTQEYRVMIGREPVLVQITVKKRGQPQLDPQLAEQLAAEKAVSEYLKPQKALKTRVMRAFKLAKEGDVLKYAAQRNRAQDYAYQNEISPIFDDVLPYLEAAIGFHEVYVRQRRRAERDDKIGRIERQERERRAGLTKYEREIEDGAVSGSRRRNPHLRRGGRAMITGGRYQGEVGTVARVLGSVGYLISTPGGDRVVIDINAMGI